MKTYLISYDLIKPEDDVDYTSLINYIKSGFNGWAKLMKSTWLVRTNEDVSTVRTNLRQKMDTNDKLVVIDVSGSNWGTFNVSKTVTQWMQNNV